VSSRVIGSVLTWLDGVMASAGLAAVARVIVWGAVGGMAVMELYALVSPQRKLAEIEKAANEAQQALLAHDGSFAEARQLMKRSVGLSLKRLALALGPSVVAGLPVLALLLWMGGHYAHRLPTTGSPITVEVKGVSSNEVDWQPSSAARWDAAAKHWRVRWPGRGKTVTLKGPSGETALALPTAAPTPQIGPWRWWHALFANPSGYVPATSAVKAVHLHYPSREFWSIGPRWARVWWVTFLVVVPIAALVTKFIFRIK
jgi:hypothetical protein